MNNKLQKNLVLSNAELDKEKEYWVDKLSGELEACGFPFDKVKGENIKPIMNFIEFDFCEQVQIKLNELSKGSEKNLYYIMLTCVFIILNKYTGNTDIIVGAPIYKQKNEDNFINTALVLRNNFDESATFKELLVNVKNTVVEAVKNQNYPLDILVEELGQNSLNTLLQTVVLLENIQDIKYIEDIASNIVFSFSQIDSNIMCKLHFNTMIYEQSTIERISSHFNNLLSIILNNINVKLSDIDVMSDTERQKILYEFNNTDALYPNDTTVASLFEQQVERTPEGVAVLYRDNSLNDKSITYKELNDKSNQLARVLRAKGVGPDSIVGIMVERSLEMMVGIYAILKAGGAYLPIDPEYPQDRIEYMLKDSNAEVLLTRLSLTDKVSFENVICFEDDIIAVDTSNLEPLAGANNLAYVIYTSGSTGNPKGAMIEHHSIINRLKWGQKKYPISSNDVVLQKTSYTFDVSVWELLWWSLEGAKICMLVSGGEKDPEEIVRTIQSNKVTIMHFVPSMLNVFIEYLELNREFNKILSLRQVFASGEALAVNQVERFTNIINKNCGAILTNLYGPTEASVEVSYFDFNIGEKLDRVPIGKPIDNIKLLVIDKNKKLQPIGVPGELCISGVGLARGYLNRPELTEEKFVENPYEICNESGVRSKMYRTGDLARWLPDGNIEFLGRLDYQVKIRGFRIELGEIENKLLVHEYIKEAVVIAKEDANGNKYLCAYISCAAGITTTEELKEYLLRDLPEYMIPSYFIQLDKLPLTSNGKIDRKALADTSKYPESDIHNTKMAKYEAPRNFVEEKLLEVWEEVLGVEHIGINDSFFALGGDSIKAIQVSSRLQKHQLKLEVTHLLHNPKVKDLSKHVIQNNRKAEQGLITGDIKLTPIQNWFFEKDIINNHHWNQATMLYKHDGFNTSALTKAFDKLVEHHDMLRTIFEQNEGSIRQFNRELEGQLYTLNEFDFTKEQNIEELIEAEANKLQSSMDIAKGPLIKLGLFRTSQGDHLLIAIHHLIIDGVSWRIIFEDLAIAYNQALNEENILLQDKTDSFKLWSEELYNYANSKMLLRELGYWNELDKIEVKPIPKDKQSDKIFMKDLNTVSISLSERDTERLLKEANKSYNTEINDILVTALGMTIKKWTGNDKVLISMEGHGRDLRLGDLDITRTVGWFTSEYSVVLDMSYNNKLCKNIYEEQNISYQIKNIKENLRHIPKKGIGYGILKYITLPDNKEGTAFTKKADIGFNYLGQFDNDINTDIFTFSNMPSGSSASPDSEALHSIEIGGMVAAGKLTMNFDYNSNQYYEETINKIAEDYKESLINIINHCTGKGEIELTPSDTTGKRVSLKEFEVIKEVLNLQNIEPKQIEDMYPLSPMQDGILFHKLVDEDTNSYFEQTILSIEGKLDIELFQASLNSIIEKYDVLRTIFVYEKVKKSVQVVLKERKSQIQYFDITEMEQEHKTAYIEEYKEKDKERNFELNKDIPLRVSIIELEEESYKIIWSFHHIIMDGWCQGIIMKDFFQYYVAKRDGEIIETDETKPYGKFIQWLEEQDKEDAKSYWAKYLEGYDSQAIIPFEDKTTKTPKYKKEDIVLMLSEDITDKLTEYGKTEGITLNTLLQAMWGILLQRYNNTEDVVFGAVVSGRPAEIEDVENMIGLFINTIPIRVSCSSEKSFGEEAKEVQKRAGESNKYDYMPLAEIQTTSQLKQKLIDHVLVFENYPVEQQLEEMSSENKLGFGINNVESFEQTSYNFNLIFVPQKELIVKFSYNAEVYTKDSINKIKENFKTLIERVIENPDIKIKDIDFISADEKKQLLFDFNDTKAEYPRDKSISDLFEEQVQKNPESIAVMLKDSSNDTKTLTYKELNIKANQLARVLRDKNVEADSIVGIIVERSLEMIIGIMGILKAGGAYLPIDPEYPRERIQYMLDDSCTKILLTEKQLRENVSFEGEVIELDNETLYSGDCNDLEPTNKPSDLAYIIYTSGTTGNPKGTMIEHKNVVRLLFNSKIPFDFNNSDIWTMFHSYCFDFSVWEMYGALLYGGKLIIVPKSTTKNTNEYLKLLRSEGVTILNQTPSVFYRLIEEELQYEDCDLKLRNVIFGGEALQPKMLKEFYDKYPKTKLINMYGITETTVHVTYKEIANEEINSNISNIGKTIPTLTAYVMDKNMKLLPIGVAGELCVGGDGVARGYLNRPELTAEKFLMNQYKENERLYRSGDLVKLLSNGEMEYLGRIDNQVKIRGFRIELGEIQNAIKEQDGVKDAVVLVRGSGNSENNYLCAYVIIEGTDIQSIKAGIKKKLPDYMVPNSYIIIDEIPITVNGKVDTQALQSMQRQDDNRKKILPISYFDTIIADIWKEVLGLDEVYIYDDFFELGGNSINIIQVSNQMKKALEIDVTPADLMAYKTISELSEFLTDKDITNRGQFKNVFKINKSKSSKNIFIVHGGDTNIFYYRHLAKLLEDEYSVYGIQPTGLNGEDPLPISYYQMLHGYISEIRMIQEKGPYIIGGYCIGGYLSFDIVKIMEIQGDEVGAMLQLDQEAFIEAGWEKGISKNTRLFKTIDMGRRITGKDKLYTMEKHMEYFPKPEPLSKERQLELLKDRKALQHHFQREIPVNSKYQNIGCFVKSPTLVVKAVDNPHPLLTKELWEKMARGPLEYYVIPGEHETVLLPPYVEKMAEIISEYLKKVVRS